MINKEDLDVFVIAHHSRPAIITDYLKDIPHTVHWNPDYDWEPGLNLNKALLSMAWNPLNMYRAFKGHVDVTRASKKPYLLVLEDDARPNRDDWFDIVLESGDLLKEVEVVSYHGRECDPRDLDHIKYPSLKDRIVKHKDEELCFSKPQPMHNDDFGRTWCLGSCMAYLIRHDAKHKMYDHKYNGLPIDFIVPQFFDFLVMRKTCFIHDRQHGTLMN
jgi:hypothetical protein